MNNFQLIDVFAQSQEIGKEPKIGGIPQAVRAIYHEPMLHPSPTASVEAGFNVTRPKSVTSDMDLNIPHRQTDNQSLSPHLSQPSNLVGAHSGLLG